MFDVLKTLSMLVKSKKPVKQVKPIIKKVEPEKPVVQATPVQPKVPVVTDEDRKQLEYQIKLAEAKAKELVLEARDEAIRIRNQAEDDARRKMEAIDRREGAVEERERHISEKIRDLDEKTAKIDQLKNEFLVRLEKVAKLTHEEARTLILTQIKDKLKEEVAKEIKEAQDEAHEVADVKAREIIVDSMRHGATDYVSEYTTSVIKIGDEDAKGRIIGKEGRNIRAFETATGVDVDLDEEGVIRLSCFDSVRREVARIALERLLRDGRVQPGRIEEVVDQVRREIDRVMFEEGQKLCHAIGVYNLPAPLVAYLGKFKYRFSYGQNMIAHTLEETKIGIALAHEVGADPNITRLGCLLHDIGKVITDQEGNHVDLGVALLKKYNMPQRVIDCVAQHHEDKPFSSVESALVYIADAISGSRPGARYENYDEYIKRLQDLENIAKNHEGVKESFAFSAGRELRVLVDPGKVDDATATILARDIKDEIQKKLTYPGTIKISVIRELRATETAS
jgi:ribonucrease Y